MKPLELETNEETPLQTNKTKEIVEESPILKNDTTTFKRRKPDSRYTTKLALIMTIATVIMLFVLYVIFNLIPTTSSSSNKLNRFLEDTSSGDCSDINLVKREDQCIYAYECDDGKGIPFFPNLYCYSYGANTVALLLSPFLIILLITLFRVLGSTAEDYFSPGLEMFSSKIGLPPRFAGVTLLALGNGCPDVSASANAIRSNPSNGYLLSLGALTGAGMFIGCVVSGAVIMAAGGVPCRGALVRDVVMYGLSLFVVFRQLKRGYIDQASIHLFVGMYFSFVVIVLIADIYHRKVVLPRLQEAQNKLNHPPTSANESSSEEESPKSDPIPVRVVRSTLLAMSNYTTMESAYLDRDEPTPVLHGKHGILAHKNLLRSVSEEEPDTNDYFNCGENPYTAMVDSVEALEMTTWCTTDDATNVSATSWRNAFVEFRRDFVDHWKEYWRECWDDAEQWLEKFLFLLELPAIIARKVTVPVPTDGYYCRAIIALSIILSPIWLSVYIFLLHDTNIFVKENSGIPIFWILQFVALIVGLLIIRFAPGGEGPMPLYIATPIALYGFVIAASWIDFIAGRLVSLLNFLGILLRIPSSIMGLTVLAWGNSMSDLSANMAMARRGLANMAMTACYAGPVFNILISLSVGFSALQGEHKTTSTEVHMNPSISTGFLFLFVNCFMLLTTGLLLNPGYIPTWYCYVAVGLYSVYVVSSILLQMK